MPVKYTFVSKDNDDWASIIIQEGEYEGIIYQYGQVSVPESEDENGNMPLSFKYNVIPIVHKASDDGVVKLHNAALSRVGWQ